MKILGLMLIPLILLFGCTSNKFKTTLDVNDQEVVKKFELSKDMLTKFSDSKAVTKSKKKGKKKVKVKKRGSYKNKMKKVVRKKKHIDAKKKLTKVKSKKSKKNQITEQKVAEVERDPSKADGYPEKFVKFDKNSEGVWDSYRENIYIHEKSTYKVKYIGATAGTIEIETLPLTTLNEEEVYHFKALVKTANYYSFIYWVNDTLHSYVARDGFLPLKYVLAQREKKQDIDDLQLFDRDKLKTIFLYRKVKNGKTTKREVTKDIPFFFQDSFSSIQFVRGLPLKVGTRFYYPVVNKAKYWLLKMHVVRKETLDIMDKEVEAYKIAAETQFPGALKKAGDIFFWYSTDPTQRLLKFEGKVKIGTLAGELIDYQAGNKLR